MLFAALALAGADATRDTQLLAPLGLRVEHLYSPSQGKPVLGVNTARPRLSFNPAVAENAVRGASLAAYRVVVEPQSGGDAVWDSGRVNSSESHLIECGTDLKSASAYRWRAMWWAADCGSCDPSPWSDYMSFETGLWTDADWSNATWLGSRSQKLLRLRFTVPEASSSRVRAYIAAPGGHVARFNGVGDDTDVGVMAWTSDNTVMYKVHDFDASDLKSGSLANELTVQLGSGFWAGAKSGKSSNTPGARVKLTVGDKVFVSQVVPREGEAVWEATRGPVVSDDPWFGTTTNWSTATSSDWVPVEATPNTGCPSVEKATFLPINQMPLSRIVRTLRPMSVKPLNGSDTEIIVAFQENFVGHIYIPKEIVSGPAGANISLRHGEVLNADGSCCHVWSGFTVDNLQRDVHILGESDVDLSPLFTWHGFQYAQITLGGGAKIDLSRAQELIQGRETVTDLDRTSDIQFTGGPDGVSETLTGLHSMTINSQRANIAAYMPTDCPTREKHGWLGDSLVTAVESMYTLDTPTMHNFFVSTLIGDDQGTGPTYNVPVAVPGSSGKKGDISWTAAYPIETYRVYERFGDLGVAERNWKGISSFVDWLTSYAVSQKRPDGLPDFFQFGDWCAVEDRKTATPGTGPTLAAANYLMAVEALAKLATALGKSDDAQRYSQLHANMSAAYQSLYFNPNTSSYDKDALERQTLTTTSMGAGLVPGKVQADVIKSLEDDIVARNYHLTVGATGAQFLLPQLSRAGLHDAALRVASQRSFPSWGNWLEKGATTCWENWSGVADESHPPEPTHNHIFLCGGLGEWMYSTVAGVTPDAPGYAKIRVSPRVSTKYGPSAVSASVRTVRGNVSVSWALPGDSDAPTRQLTLDVTVPVGAGDGAVVVIPGVDGRPADICEGGTKVWTKGAYQPGVQGIRGASVVEIDAKNNKGIAVEVGSGSYNFVSVEMGASC